jgi:hypothetical protein
MSLKANYAHVAQGPTELVGISGGGDPAGGERPFLPQGLRLGTLRWRKSTLAKELNAPM